MVLWTTNLLKYHFFFPFIKFKWRDCHHTPALFVDVTDSMNEALVAWEQLPGALPPCQISYKSHVWTLWKFWWILYYNSDDFNDKSKCFDYGEIDTTREIEDNLDIDVGIILTLMKKSQWEFAATLMEFGQRQVEIYEHNYWLWFTY